MAVPWTMPTGSAVFTGPIFTIRFTGTAGTTIPIMIPFTPPPGPCPGTGVGEAVGIILTAGGITAGTRPITVTGTAPIIHGVTPTITHGMGDLADITTIITATGGLPIPTITVTEGGGPPVSAPFTEAAADGGHQPPRNGRQI